MRSVFIRLSLFTITILFLGTLVMPLMPITNLSSRTHAAIQQGALSKKDILDRLKASSRKEISQGDIAGEINDRGISFELSDSVLTELRQAGAKSLIIDAILRASARKPTPADEVNTLDRRQPNNNNETTPRTPLASTRPRNNANDNNDANSVDANTDPNSVDGYDKNDNSLIDSLPFIEQARRYALNYVQELPNFIVHQRVNRYARDPVSGKWVPRDNLDLEVTYEVSKGEQYILRAINGRPTKNQYNEVGGASSAGEFGSLLVALFNPSSKAEFKRGPKESISGRKAVVYDFHVPTATSSNQITETRSNKSVISGYRGSIWVDEESKRVLRIEQSADDIPRDFPLSVAESAVDYGWFDINGKQYLLPRRAEVIIGSERDQLYSRNVLEFTDYRKFEVDLKIGDLEEDKDK